MRKWDKAKVVRK